MASERDADLVEHLVDREVVHSSKYLIFVRDTIADPDGERRVREIVIHPGAVTVVAVLPDGQLLLVRQYRHACGKVMLELPAGTLDRQPDGSLEDPLAAAQRELFEETGHRAADWRRLATFYTAPGFATERMSLYLATGVTPDPSYAGPDADERLRLETITFAEAMARVRRDEIDDAKSLVGLYALEALVRAGEIAGLRLD